MKIKPQHQKSIKIDNQKKVCDRFLIIVDWIVSTFIDNDRFLSTIGILDMLRPVYKWTGFTVREECRGQMPRFVPTSQGAHNLAD